MYFDNEEQIIKKNREDNLKVRKRMAHYGFEENKTDFFETKAYEKMLITFIKSKQKRIYNYNLPPKSTKLIKTKANKFLISKTEDIDRNVLYLDSYYKLVYDFTAKYGEIDKSKYDLFLEYLKQNTIKKEVTKLPVQWLVKESRNGGSKTLAEYLSDDLEFIKKFPVISKGITLKNQNDLLGSTALVHEMTHILIDRHKGIIKNLMHNEILTIYMQLLSAYEIDPSGKLFDLAVLARLQDTKSSLLALERNYFNGYTLDNSEEYIVSSLYAFDLFEKYKNAKDQTKKLITNEINKTLEGNRELEDTLEKLEIDKENGSEIINNHVKKLMK